MAAAALDDDFSDLEASDFEDEAVSCSAATRRQAGNCQCAARAAGACSPWPSMPLLARLWAPVCRVCAAALPLAAPTTGL